MLENGDDFLVSTAIANGDDKGVLLPPLVVVLLVTVFICVFGYLSWDATANWRVRNLPAGFSSQSEKDYEKAVSSLNKAMSRFNQR